MESQGAAPREIDLQATLELVLKNAVEAVEGGAGVVATWDETEHRFVTSASYGLDSKSLARLRPLLDEAIPDLAGSRDSFDLLSRLRPESSLPTSSQEVVQDPVMALPLRVGGRAVGLIYVLRPLKATSFSNLDQPVLAAFADQAAIAVQNAMLAHLLSEEKQRIEAILEGSAEGIMSIDAQRRVVEFNAAMERLTGYPREEVVGAHCYRVLGLRDWEGKTLCDRQCPMLMHGDEGRRTWEQEGMISRKDGGDAEVAMVYSMVRSRDCRPLNAVVNVRDISGAREVEALRSTFLSMVGHELQTPLSIIKGYTSTLARGDGKWDEETVRQGLQIIEDECDRLSKLMRGLLLASRIETGILPLQREPVMLPSLAGKVVRKLQGTTGAHRFEVKFERSFPPVPADPELTEQVLTNLVDNAIKYSPDGGIITIAGKASGEEVEVAVTDQGIGIPPQEVEHVFERFHRADVSAVHRVPGLGLGLYICKTIVEAHGGAIDLSSTPGEGSCVTFTLPRQGSTEEVDTEGSFE